jgi:hypothetical protein
MSTPHHPRRVVGWVVAAVVVLVLAVPAAAHRPPTGVEFSAIAKSVARNTHRFYCPTPGGVDISTRDPRWSAAFAISNCGAGSGETRFYLRRPTRLSEHWRVVEQTGSRGIGTGTGPPCAGGRVPADIRCGVRGRS